MKQTRRLVLMSLLVALGMILNLIEIPYLFMNLDFSEVIVLIATHTVGLGGAIVVSIAKMIISILVKGPVGPIAIGQITGLIASLTIAITYHVFRMKFKWKLTHSLMMMTVVLSIVMTLANYLFITPTYFLYSPATFVQLKPYFDVANYDFLAPVKSFTQMIPFLSPYANIIIVLYLPFNFLKGLLISVVYIPLDKVIIPKINQYLKR